MLQDAYPYFLANEPVHANTDLAVTNKYTGGIATHVAKADEATIDRAIAAAVDGFRAFRLWPSHRRKAVLEHVVHRMHERSEELAEALCIEGGKPIKDARTEVTRGIDTFTLAAEESTRMYGEVMPLDITPRAEGYQSIWKRVPAGPCSFISPFNFPINLAAHKIAAALAVGCSFILKPASSTPVSSILLGEILAETDLPRGTFSILPCSRDGADLFTSDERLKVISFTGSPEAGWDIKARAGRKRVVLELGGNAGCIVDADADLTYAADRLVLGAYYQSGQSCISVQRILAHRSVYDQLRALLKQRIAALQVGDPLDEATFIGPVISEADAERLEHWVGDAVQAGASVVVGGRRHPDNPRVYLPTLLEGVPHDARVSCAEVFGPVATIEPFDDFDRAVEIVNDSVYGLQAGVFTRDIHRAFRAYRDLEVGGVVVNDIPSMRVDNMPYGGIKDSGIGREGVRFAMEDMTEIKLMVLARIGEM
jgi:acyl-CoA reductase-like NAD-dependent aldehyde dehydrogenase